VVGEGLGTGVGGTDGIGDGAGDGDGVGEHVVASIVNLRCTDPVVVPGSNTFQMCVPSGGIPLWSPSSSKAASFMLVPTITQYPS
jgi:hypothetical protein